MPFVIQGPPNQRLQVWNDYISRLQAERRRREEERAEEREKQKKRIVTIPTTIVGAVLGGVGAAAAGAVGGAAAGAGSIATGALTGGAIGARIGQQFVGGDFAGGLASAATAAQGLMQAQEDRVLYGGSVTPRERLQFDQAALKAGQNPVELKGLSLQTGRPFMDFVQAAQAEQADVEQLDDLARDLDLGVTGSNLRAMGDTYPGGLTQLIEDQRARTGEIKAEAAGHKQFAEVKAGIDARLQATAQRENMEFRTDPRLLTKFSADQNAIDEAIDSEDITLEQGTRMKANLRRPAPAWVPRRTPPSIYEMELGALPIKMPNGQVVGFGVASLDRDNKPRYHGSLSEQTGPARTFQEFIDRLSPPQKVDAVSKVRQQLFLEQREGEPAPTTADIRKRMEDNFAVYQDTVGPSSQDGTQGAPGGSTQVPPPVQRAAQVVETLLQRANQKPIDTWADQELVLAGESIDAAVLNLQESGSKDPKLLAILAQLLEFRDVIHAKRNR